MATKKEVETPIVETQVVLKRIKVVGGKKQYVMREDGKTHVIAKVMPESFVDFFKFPVNEETWEVVDDSVLNDNQRSRIAKLKGDVKKANMTKEELMEERILRRLESQGRLK